MVYQIAFHMSRVGAELRGSRPDFYREVLVQVSTAEVGPSDDILTAKKGVQVEDLAGATELEPAGFVVSARAVSRQNIVHPHNE